MAHSLNLRAHSLWRNFNSIGKNLKDSLGAARNFSNLVTDVKVHPSFAFSNKSEHDVHQDTAFDSIKIEGLVNNSSQNDIATSSSSKGRVMLIDGTSVIYRSYFKLLAKLHHGHLSHADGNGDWVLTIFSALSHMINVLEFIPSHVAVVFDHDGVPFGHTSVSSKENVMAKGMFYSINYPKEDKVEHL
ncbi:5'-3' exonuclease family protein [Euphorbia peplus]|nr:5'-3' exonuclease family protein [Euphorbia peplus]